MGRQFALGTDSMPTCPGPPLAVLHLFCQVLFRSSPNAAQSSLFNSFGGLVRPYRAPFQIEALLECNSYWRQSQLWWSLGAFISDCCPSNQTYMDPFLLCFSIPVINLCNTVKTVAPTASVSIEGHRGDQRSGSAGGHTSRLTLTQLLTMPV